MPKPFDIFLTCPPGLEPLLAQEAVEAGFASAQAVPGGVQMVGHWTAILRANLWLRGASRVLVRLSRFRAMGFPQLETRAGKVDWGALIGPGRAVHVEATCKGSRLQHGGAVAARIATAISAATGAPVAEGVDGALRVFARVEDNLVTLSLDTSGALLHRRGAGQFTGKAPLRETMAALLLRACGYRGGEPVLDPMCGSGTIPIEAAAIALGQVPGRARSFAFEEFTSFDPDLWQGVRADLPPMRETDLRFDGRDRDAGAVAGALENAARAGLGQHVRIAQASVSDLTPPPEGRPGLVFCNPPYGERIGGTGRLQPLYRSLGQGLAARFSGWRAALITTQPELARATGLDLRPVTGPIPHGGLTVRLWLTDPLP